MANTKDFYSSPIGITSQFRFCGNCFRVDTYKGCSFGCSYCFINNRHENNPRMGDRLDKVKPADIKQIERLFSGAIDKKQDNTIEKELLIRRVPLHLGGNSDPFQAAEKHHRVTLDFLRLSKKYNYPVMISTKTGEIEDVYFDALDPSIHAFQISLISKNDDFISKFEANTSAIKRIWLIKKLHELGFWISVRIQPLIDINEAILLIKEVEPFINYITVEHIKLQNDNTVAVNMMKNLLQYPESFWIRKGNSTIIKTEIKRENIEKIRAITNIPIGCGDNDLHELSDSLNCCGIDCINDNFKNWLKYNAMTINMGLNDPMKFKGKMNVFPYIKKEFLHTFDDYVDFFVKNLYIAYRKPEKKLFD